MLSSFRLKCQTNLTTVTFTLLVLLLMREETHADETLISTEHSWIAMECSADSSQAQIRQDSRRSYELNRPTFVITHGMGGTETGDRFHQLADAISQAMPECNVLIIDWSKQSWRIGWFGFPNPFAVAQNIDPVAMEAFELLKSLQIDPTQTTFIGESFGNCVNARIAATFGGRGRILAFNPANDAGGYKTPDLRACSSRASMITNGATNAWVIEAYVDWLLVPALRPEIGWAVRELGESKTGGENAYLWRKANPFSIL